MRTNIDIDDKLMKKAIKASRLERKTKKAVVTEALELLVRIRAQEGIRRLYGAMPDWDDGRQGLPEKDKWAESDARFEAAQRVSHRRANAA